MADKKQEEKIILYRIQDSDGTGPYKEGFSSSWVEGRDDLKNLKNIYQDFPCFWEKVNSSRNSHFGCACRTPEQLKRWFTKTEYKRLKHRGYRAVKLLAHEIVNESETQVLFGRNQPFNIKPIPFNLY